MKFRVWGLLFVEFGVQARVAAIAWASPENPMWKFLYKTTPAG